MAHLWNIKGRQGQNPPCQEVLYPATVSPRFQQIVEELVAQHRAEVNRAATFGESWERRVAFRRAMGSPTVTLPVRFNPYYRPPTPPVQTLPPPPAAIEALNKECQEASTQTEEVPHQPSTPIAVQTEPVLVLELDDDDEEFDMEDIDVLGL